MKKMISIYAMILLFATVIFQANAVEASLAAEPAKTFIFEGPAGERVEIKIPENIIDKMNFFKGFESIEEIQSFGGPDMTAGNQEAIDIPYFVIENFIKKYSGMSYELFISYLKYLVELLQSTFEDPFDQSKIDSFMNLGRIAFYLGCEFPEYITRSLEFNQDFVYSTCLQSDGGGISSVKLSPDGKYAVIRSGGGPSRLWDLRDKDHITSTELQGHKGAVAFSPDGQYALAKSVGGAYRLWDLRDKKNISSFKFPIYIDSKIIKIIFSADANYALILLNTMTVLLYDLRDKNNISRIPLDGAKEVTACDIALSPDGNYAMTGQIRNHPLLLWDLRDKAYPTSIVLPGHKDRISSVAFSPEGTYALTGSDDGTAFLWDLRDKDHITSIELRGHTGEIRSVAFSSDGNYAMTGAADKTARLWDLRDKTNITSTEFQGHTGSIYLVALNADGSFGATLSSDGSVRWWNRCNKKYITLQTYQPHMNLSDYVSFNLDGDYALIVSNDNAVRLWNLHPLKKNIDPEIIGFLIDLMRIPDDYKSAFIDENQMMYERVLK